MENIDAKLLAINAHFGQFRKKGGYPAVAHVLRVENLLIDHFSHIKEIDTLRQAALLHDTIEDTWVDESFLRNKFSSEVVDLVLELTREDGPKEITVPKYINSLKESSDLAKIVKLCDVYDNLCTPFSGKAWLKYVNKANSFLKVLDVDDKNFKHLKSLALEKVDYYLK